MIFKNSMIPVSGLVFCLFATLAFPQMAKADKAFDGKAIAKLSKSASFRQFIDEMRPRALKKGVSARVYNRAMRGLEPNPVIEKRANNQPEFNITVWKYINSRVSAKRIKTGGAMKARHRARIAAIEKRYGVDRHVLLAIWGMESNYGSYKGKLSIIRSLATLGYQGRRKKFGQQQLLAALQILQKGDVSVNQFTGSWAGAMGHTQFIPTTYNAYAVDWTGDGKRDIWNSVSDALASTGNYLNKSGWRPTRPWGWEVKLPKGFNFNHIGKGGKRTTLEWKKLGVSPANGERYGVSDAVGHLILPAGRRGPAFLVTKNFKAILAYNASVSYALAVGHLADRIRGGKPFKTRWPVNDKLLKRAERKELQTLLTAKGFYKSRISGQLGRKTAKAIRAYQRKSGLAPDGYANLRLLKRLRSGR